MNEIHSPVEQLRTGLVERAIKVDEGWKRSGRSARWTIDCRSALLDSATLALAGRIVWQRVRELDPEAVCGTGLGAHALIGAVLCAASEDRSDLKGLLIRPQRKLDGMRRLVEGPQVRAAARTVLVDDVANSGITLVEAATIVKTELNIEVRDAVVIVNFDRGAHARLADCGVNLTSLYSLDDLGLTWDPSGGDE